MYRLVHLLTMKRRAPTTNRTIQCKIMLSKEERDGIVKIAKAKGISVSDIIRMWIRAGVGLDGVGLETAT